MPLFSKEDQSLKELFIDEVKDIYWAEQHLAEALPKMADGSTSADLKKAFQDHLVQTKNHIVRLEQVFKSIGEEAEAVKCQAMNGLLKEADELLGETEEGTLVRDVAVISASQKVEHYEIATYGTLKTLAKVLGYNEAAGLFDATLQEEKAADELLTSLAESHINADAASEQA